MAKHIVLGGGNLGMDLLTALPFGSALMGEGWRFPKDGLKHVLKLNPDYVWCCVGGGSVEWVEKNPVAAFEAMLYLPKALMNELPSGTRLILFSSDYAASEEKPSDPGRGAYPAKSLYAQIKRNVELLAELERPYHTRVIRVCSLYGNHAPEKNLAHKIRRNARAQLAVGKPLSLPRNFITPTPTEWLSDFLVQNLDRLFRDPQVIQHCAPNGNVLVSDYGRWLLGEHSAVEEREPDPKRPLNSALGCSFAEVPYWQELREEFPA